MLRQASLKTGPKVDIYPIAVNTTLMQYKKFRLQRGINPLSNETTFSQQSRYINLLDMVDVLQVRQKTWFFCHLEKTDKRTRGILQKCRVGYVESGQRSWPGVQSECGAQCIHMLDDSLIIYSSDFHDQGTVASHSICVLYSVKRWLRYCSMTFAWHLRIAETIASVAIWTGRGLLGTSCSHEPIRQFDGSFVSNHRKRELVVI